MGKTHEALEWAEKEAKKRYAGAVSQSPPTTMSSLPIMASIHVTLDRYDDLKTNLLFRGTNSSVKIVLFTGITHGTGCSTTAVNFAYALAKDTKVKTLLIDVNLRTPSLHEVFKVERLGGVSELLSGDLEIGSKIRTVGPENVSVITCGGNHSDPIFLLDSARFERMLEMINGSFNYVILDGPPILSFSESKILSGKADGVVLVLESGKTRRQVAIRAKKQIEEAGGKILGVVLNKRKHYIPNWIYKRL